MPQTRDTTARQDARAIWDAGLAAVQAERLVPAVLAGVAAGLQAAAEHGGRIVVVGGGKAGGSMSAALETALGPLAGRLEGLVNVPDTCVRTLRRISVNGCRPAGPNVPTVAAAAGADRMLELLARAGPGDLAVCLLSGGASALLPAPVAGVSLEDKLEVTRLLLASGAPIGQINAVRKHLSRLKGGGMARAFRGRALFTLIISDVIGDPLDVIGSGPTAADRTTFVDALNVLRNSCALDQVPRAVWRHLEEGAAGQWPETLKALAPNVQNIVIGNNALALRAAGEEAQRLGYNVVNLGPSVEGETREVAAVFAGILHSMREYGWPVRPPACLLSGGETTVSLPADHGLGGRNQEMVLATLVRLQRAGIADITLLSAGTDGEDGPTDAAGAMADARTVECAGQRHLDPEEYVKRCDAYHFFEATGDLLKTGLTQTNVMDLRVFLII